MGQEPEEVNTPPAGDPQPEQRPGQDPEKFDAEYVRKLRTEAAGYRKKLGELEARFKADEDAKLSEVDQLKKRLVEIEAQQKQQAAERQERTTRYEVMLAASKLGIVDPEAAYKLLDREGLEFGEDGAPLNVDAALKTLLAAKPWLGGTPGAASAANPAADKTKGRLTIEDIKRMPQEEINKRWDEVSAVLSGGK